jgi:undecaprenyl diphosphate synthase
MTAHPDASAAAEETKSVYSSDELSLLDPKKIPKHVAIIMDGNRRWAKQRGLPPIMGHWEGAEVLTDVVRAASELGVQSVTVYTFSTENWLRSESEVEALMNVFELNLIRKREQMVRDGIRLDAIGDLSRLPRNVLDAFHRTKSETAHCNRINLILAMNYGSRDEIRRAVVKILEENERRKLSLSDITEEFISRQLDTARWGDPDLLVRTSGELRVSNFLLWQISYSEIYVTDVLWPDFSPKELLEAVLVYQGRNRRHGGGS